MLLFARVVFIHKMDTTLTWTEERWMNGLSLLYMYSYLDGIAHDVSSPQTFLLLLATYGTRLRLLMFSVFWDRVGRNRVRICMDLKSGIYIHYPLLCIARMSSLCDYNCENKYAIFPEVNSSSGRGIRRSSPLIDSLAPK
jgi:hypothetical protein